MEFHENGFDTPSRVSLKGAVDLATTHRPERTRDNARQEALRMLAKAAGKDWSEPEEPVRDFNAEARDAQEAIELVEKALREDPPPGRRRNRHSQSREGQDAAPEN